jgi:hypothetical protein
MATPPPRFHLHPKPYASSSATFTFWSGSDTTRAVLERLFEEFANVPYTQPESPTHLATPFADVVSLPAEAQAAQMVVVYIPRFFTDDTDAAFCIRGNGLIMEFMMGCWGAEAWRGRCFVTPVVSTTAHEIVYEGRTDQEGKVDREEMWGRRHRYFYESAVEAWRKVVFDPSWVADSGPEEEDFKERAKQRVEEKGIRTTTVKTRELEEYGMEEGEVVDDAALLDGRW